MVTMELQASVEIKVTYFGPTARRFFLQTKLPPRTRQGVCGRRGSWKMSRISLAQELPRSI
jgi:hypothetical protein